MAERPRWLVAAAFILLGLIWGTSFAWIKIAVDEIPPATLVAYRMSLGAVGMLAVLPFLGVTLPRTLREWIPLLVLGAINTALPIFLISWGELFIDSGTAGVLNSLVPIFSVVIAGLILQTEPATPMRFIGVTLGFIGAALLAGRELELRGDAAGLIGAIAVVAAALSYALGASYARHRIQATNRYVVAAGALVFAAIYMWALALTTDGLVVPAQPDTLLAVAWLGLLGSFIAYVLYFFLIERLGATVATMVTYLFPLVAVTVGVTMLNEPFDVRLLVGTALIVLGIAAVTLRYDPAVSHATSEARE